MEILFIRLIESLIMPPGLMLVMMLAGSVIIGRYYRTGKTLIIAGFVLLFLFSLPIIPNSLLALLEQTPPVTPAQLKQQKVQAIVILGGGRYTDAPEYHNQDTVAEYTLERLRYGAYLQRHTGLPVLVTGGNPYGRPVPEAQLMRTTLENAFHIPVKWVEGRSANSWENASNSFAILQPLGITRIALVTHAWHMPRSISAFEQNGFQVVPAPTAYSTRNTPLILDFFPSATAMKNSRMAMHEILGRIWYAMRY